MHCTSCGTYLPDNTIFCSTCGTNLQGNRNVPLHTGRHAPPPNAPMPTGYTNYPRPPAPPVRNAYGQRQTPPYPNTSPYAPQKPKRTGNNLFIFASVAMVAVMAMILVFIFVNRDGSDGPALSPALSPAPSPAPPQEIELIPYTHKLIITSTNTSAQTLDGGVFFLFSYDQVVGGVRASVNGEPVAPMMIAIPGGLAGAAIGTQLDNVSDADWGLIVSIGSRNANSGEAIFHNLSPGTYYLYQAVAPYNYRRITGLARIHISEESADVFCIACDSYDCMYSCEPIFVHRIEFTNTGDFFTLPPTVTRP